MQNYDTIIIGAGSAGCVLANRLSADPNRSLLLVESGSSNYHPLLQVPAGWASTFRNSKFDWGYSTDSEQELHGRKVYWPRGRVLGGSSSINGMIYIRGIPADFDRWTQVGAVGWDYSDVLPYFRKAEAQERCMDEYHGHEGPLHVQDVRDRRKADDFFLKGMNEIGIPRNDDFNGEKQAGCGYYQLTQRNGRRWSAANAYLDPVKNRPNLHIRTRTTAQRITFNDRTVKGVVLSNAKQGDYEVGARQVIISAGSVNSPQLLELSGIGNASRLQGLGIKVLMDQPEVGENLQDHLMTKVVYGTLKSNSINREVLGWRLLPTSIRWLLFRSGALTNGSATAGGFWFSRSGLVAPDIQIHFASGATLHNNKGRIRALDSPAITAVVGQSRPESTGSVHITKNRANVPPLIKANYLSSEIARRTVVDGLRLLIKIFESKSMSSVVTRRVSPQINIDSDTELLDYIRSAAITSYHPTSTCRIGSVVDNDLRVYGVHGLSVVDASIMPYVVSGNTNAATIMIAEKAANKHLEIR